MLLLLEQSISSCTQFCPPISTTSPIASTPNLCLCHTTLDTRALVPNKVSAECSEMPLLKEFLRPQFDYLSETRNFKVCRKTGGRRRILHCTLQKALRISQRCQHCAIPVKKPYLANVVLQLLIMHNMVVVKNAIESQLTNGDTTEFQRKRH